jgi:hypothetical protein
MGARNTPSHWPYRPSKGHSSATVAWRKPLKQHGIAVRYVFNTVHRPVGTTQTKAFFIHEVCHPEERSARP